MNIDKLIQESMKSGGGMRTLTLRALKSALNTKALSKGNINRELSDSEFLETVRSQIKQRQDSFSQFSSAGRTDLAEKEKAELEILKEFLPAQLSDDELNKIIDSAICKVQATSKKQMGAVMKLATAEIAGRADSRTVSEKVAAKLA